MQALREILLPVPAYIGDIDVVAGRYIKLC